MFVRPTSHMAIQKILLGKKNIRTKHKPTILISKKVGAGMLNRSVRKRKQR